MSEIKSYRDLKVWQKSIGLAALCYELTATFPESERYGLCSQMNRGSVSVSGNIAEGFGRGHLKDYIRFLQIASGSLFELQSQLEISRRLTFVAPDKCEEFEKLCLEVEKMLG